MGTYHMGSKRYIYPITYKYTQPTSHHTIHTTSMEKKNCTVRKSTQFHVGSIEFPYIPTSHRHKQINSQFTMYSQNTLRTTILELHRLRYQQNTHTTHHEFNKQFDPTYVLPQHRYKHHNSQHYHTIKTYLKTQLPH